MSIKNGLARRNETPVLADPRVPELAENEVLDSTQEA